jgi:hypothetical protein
MLLDKIPRLYPGCHAIVCATGPGLTSSVIETVKSAKDRFLIIGVNDTYKVIDFMDEHYSCDARWWKVHGEKVNALRPGLSSWCYDDEGEKYGCKRISGIGKPGFSTDPSLIHFGSNSGYQALNLAYLWGCTKMLLVGFNMQKVNNRSHFFEGREKSLNTNSPYHKFVLNYNTIQEDIANRIINCTPNSALTKFKYQPLEEAIK